MKRNYLKLFVEELEKGDEGKPYDFICQNAYFMGVDTLADIVKECLCLDSLLPVLREDLYKAIAENLREWHEEEIEESEEE